MQGIELETSSQVYRLLLPFLLALSFHTLFLCTFQFLASQPSEMVSNKVRIAVVQKKIEHSPPPKKPPAPVKKKVAKPKTKKPEKGKKKEVPKVKKAEKKVLVVEKVIKREAPKPKEITKVPEKIPTPLPPPIKIVTEEPLPAAKTPPPLFAISLSSTVKSDTGSGVSVPTGRGPSGTYGRSPEQAGPGTSLQPKTFSSDTVDEMPVLIKEIRPEFPEEAKQKGWEGTVLLELTLDEKGLVTEVGILKGINEILDESAKKAAYKFLFSPAKHAHKSVAVRIDYAITFRFQN